MSLKRVLLGLGIVEVLLDGAVARFPLVYRRMSVARLLLQTI